MPERPMQRQSKTIMMNILNVPA